MNIQIFDEIVFSSLDSIIHIGTPSEVIFQWEKFYGQAGISDFNKSIVNKKFIVCKFVYNSLFQFII